MRTKPSVEWRPRARINLSALIINIAEDNPDAAQELKDEIETKTAKLPNHPKLYKISPRIKGLRELVVRANYIVFYRETPNLIEVVNVVHARRQWPSIKNNLNDL